MHRAISNAALTAALVCLMGRRCTPGSPPPGRTPTPPPHMLWSASRRWPATGRRPAWMAIRSPTRICATRSAPPACVGRYPVPGTPHQMTTVFNPRWRRVVLHPLLRQGNHPRMAPAGRRNDVCIRCSTAPAISTDQAGHCTTRRSSSSATTTARALAFWQDGKPHADARRHHDGALPRRPRQTDRPPNRPLGARRRSACGCVDARDRPRRGVPSGRRGAARYRLSDTNVRRRRGPHDAINRPRTRPRRTDRARRPAHDRDIVRIRPVEAGLEAVLGSAPHRRFPARRPSSARSPVHRRARRPAALHRPNFGLQRASKSRPDAHEAARRSCFTSSAMGSAVRWRWRRRPASTRTHRTRSSWASSRKSSSSSNSASSRGKPTMKVERSSARKFARQRWMRRGSCRPRRRFISLSTRGLSVWNGISGREDLAVGHHWNDLVDVAGTVTYAGATTAQLDRPSHSAFMRLVQLAAPRVLHSARRHRTPRCPGYHQHS